MYKDLLKSIIKNNIILCWKWKLSVKPNKLLLSTELLWIYLNALECAMCSNLDRQLRKFIDPLQNRNVLHLIKLLLSLRRNSLSWPPERSKRWLWDYQKILQGDLKLLQGDQKRWSRCYNLGNKNRSTLLHHHQNKKSSLSNPGNGMAVCVTHYLPILTKDICYKITTLTNRETQIVSCSTKLP